MRGIATAQPQVWRCAQSLMAWTPRSTDSPSHTFAGKSENKRLRFRSASDNDASSATEDGIAASIPATRPSNNAQGDTVAAKRQRKSDPIVSGAAAKDEKELRKECKETLKCVSDGLK